MGCCGTSICAVCPGCGGVCGTCFCPSSTDAFCGGCLTGNAAPCGPTTAAYNAGACSVCAPSPGSNVDLCNLPLTAPSGDPNLDGLTPAANTTDNPAHPSCCLASPRGGGSGGGSAPSRGSGGGGSVMPHHTACANVSRLSSLLNRFGSTLAGLFGKAETAKTNLETKAINTVTTPMFLLVILIVGGILLYIAFEKHRE